jgi:AcrR family transcriptional regulator
MADILKRAGANSGGFYYFFKSKTELLCAVLDEYASNFESVILGPVFDRLDEPLKRIFGILAGDCARLTGTACTYVVPSAGWRSRSSPRRRSLFKNRDLL